MFSLKKLLLLLCLLNICIGTMQAKLDIDFDNEQKETENMELSPSANELLNEKIAVEHAQQEAKKEKEAPAPAEALPEHEKQDSAVFIEELSPALKTATREKEKITTKKRKKKEEEKIEEPEIEFNFKDEKLTTIINEIAAKKGINIVLPQGQDKAIKTTVTFELDKKIPLSRAEEYLSVMLDLAGYTMYPTDGFFVIDKKAGTPEAAETREPYHLYVNIPPKELPHGAQAIHAIYYLSNLQVPEQAGANPADAVAKILSDMVGAKRYLFDRKANAIILTGAADKIASAMTIILELDAAGSPEAIEVFPLFNANATDVANIIKSQILTVTTKGATPEKVTLHKEMGYYFMPNTRVLADTRTNSLILIGTAEAITRIREFVREYMDQLPESGKSILHVYDLQYLDAKNFALDLKNIITQSTTGQAGAAQGEGPLRMFESVIVEAETEAVAEATGAATKTAGQVKLGGNRLVIAARQDDYKRIIELIEQLDKPQLQAIIEVAILDISVTNSKALQAQLRNPTNLPLHENLQLQTAQVNGKFGGPITNVNSAGTPQGVPFLATDLLRLIGGTGTTSVAATTTPGTMVISFKDPCTSSIAAFLAILDQWVEKKIISHPFLVTKNNVKASQSLNTIRQGAGRDVASGGVTTIKVEDFTAKLAIEVTPRISSLNRLNLQIRIDINNFINASDPNSFATTARTIETNATINTGQILVIGGLMQDNISESESKWPILGDIPILGVFFRGQTKTKIKSNLVVLIHPTVVNPKLRSGEHVYTDDIIKVAREELNSEDLFSSSKDPITRWFFNSGQRDDYLVNNYLEEAHYKQDHHEGEFQPVEYADVKDLATPSKQAHDITMAREDEQPREIGKPTSSGSNNPR